MRKHLACRRGFPWSVLLTCWLALGVWGAAWGTPSEREPARGALPPAPRAAAQPLARASRSSEEGVYALLLREPSRLGCKPDATTFVQVYQAIRRRHVDEPADARLYEGVRREVGLLLEAAGVKADGLAALACDASLPNQLVARYGSRVDSSLLWYAMACGLCAGTDDPYTSYMVPRELSYIQGALDRATMLGLGAGVEIDPQSHELTVEDRIEGSPAAQSGLLAGDVVLAINDVRVKGLPIERVYALMKIRNGATVYMRTQRPGESRVRVVSIMVTPFEMPSVSSERYDRIGYIRVYAFGTTTGAQVARALAELRRQGVEALVLDLRNNGGGYVGAALDLCSMFIPSQEVVMQVVDRSSHREELRASKATPCGLPMVLLVNGYSASASEISAGCLKDYHVATLLGSRTYGKGCSQQVLPLGDGSAVKVTWAYFETPRGHRVHKLGVEPDVTLEMERRWVGQGKRDLQLQRALELLRARLSASGSPP